MKRPLNIVVPELRNKLTPIYAYVAGDEEAKEDARENFEQVLDLLNELTTHSLAEDAAKAAVRTMHDIPSAERRRLFRIAGRK